MYILKQLICFEGIHVLKSATYLDIYLEINMVEDYKQNSTRNVMSSLFKKSTSHSSVAPAYGVTFHIVILGFVSKTDFPNIAQLLTQGC